jgi:DNA sulfur modification protein DndE
LGKKWDRNNVHPAVLAGMKQAAQEIGMKTMLLIPPGQMKNGWVFCWPSTGNFRTDYMNRATIVRWGLSANTLEEGMYVGSWVSGDNKPLMGENKYTVTFVPPPFKEPAFWSATMYDWKNNYTVENPINRYSLGSDDPLKMNADGTVTLYMQSTSPGKDKESNWLPTQKSGRWYILLRSYSPGRAAIESSFDPSVWAPGPVVQVQ